VNVVRTKIPALRERSADIPLLIAHLIEKCGNSGSGT
jgi:DNA-binding NtrC family response regulator